MTLANNNQLFRCQVKISDACVLHTEQAVLEVRTSNIEESNLLSSMAFPNPFTNEVVVILQKNTPENIIIYDQWGRIIFHSFDSIVNMQIDASNWSSGVYIMQIGPEVQRIVKH